MTKPAFKSRLTFLVSPPRDQDARLSPVRLWLVDTRVPGLWLADGPPPWCECVWSRARPLEMLRVGGRALGPVTRSRDGWWPTPGEKEWERRDQKTQKAPKCFLSLTLVHKYAGHVFFISVLEAKTSRAIQFVNCQDHDITRSQSFFLCNCNLWTIPRDKRSKNFFPKPALESSKMSFKYRNLTLSSGQDGDLTPLRTPHLVSPEHCHWTQWSLAWPDTITWLTGRAH